MEQRLVDILQRADWRHLTPRMEDYADKVLRRYFWRGFRMKVGKEGQLLANGKSADDFVMEAIDALLNGPREYDFDLTLEHNLERTIESRISAWKKKSDRQPLLDRKRADAGEEEFDPFAVAVDSTTIGICEAEKDERLKHQKILMAACEASLNGDAELFALFDAYKSGFFKPADIEELTGISADRVSELKRKLVGKMDHFKTNHPSAEGAGF